MMILHDDVFYMINYELLPKKPVTALDFLPGYMVSLPSTNSNALHEIHY